MRRCPNVDETGVAQARELLAALHEQVKEISHKLETIETRGFRVSARSASHNERVRRELRRDVYEAHHHIDGIHRRFPATRPERRDWPSTHLAAERATDRRAVAPLNQDLRAVEARREVDFRAADFLAGAFFAVARLVGVLRADEDALPGETADAEGLDGC
jgi:hypothetical protein